MQYKLILSFEQITMKITEINISDSVVLCSHFIKKHYLSI
jgi:hypothetical protein